MIGEKLAHNENYNFRTYQDRSVGISIDETTNQKDIDKICKIFGVLKTNEDLLL